MEKEESFSASVPSNDFTNIDYSLDHNHPHQHHHFFKSHVGEASRDTGNSSNSNNNNNNNNSGVIDYMLNNPQQHQQQFPSGTLFGGPNSSSDRLSFADVMQFADFGPKLALNQMKNNEDETGLDPICFLKFPVLNEEKPLEYQHEEEDGSMEKYKGVSVEDKNMGLMEDHREGFREEEDGNWVSQNASMHPFLGEENAENSNKNPMVHEPKNSNNKRKRPRTIKTSEEVESQRMTHIAVERNRRRQMNEHLRVLRSLMPGSYVQRGDQASIIGGAIEFVRELEQLLQCLESQKRRRLYGDGGAPRQMGGDPSSLPIGQPPPPPPPPPQPQFFPPLPQIIPNDQIKIMDFEGGLQEETAESKSCLADVEVKVLGFDAMIKILSRRRPGQLIKTIAALEDLQLNILHTNITTIEQTVLYSFNVKVSSETRFTAEDIASSVQQIFSFINANSAM